MANSTSWWLDEQVEEQSVMTPEGDQVQQDQAVQESRIDFSNQSYLCGLQIAEHYDELRDAVSSFMKAEIIDDPDASEYVQKLKQERVATRLTSYIALTEYVKAYHSLPPTNSDLIGISANIQAPITHMLKFLADKNYVSPEIVPAFESIFKEDGTVLRPTAIMSAELAVVSEAVRDVVGGSSVVSWVIERGLLSDVAPSCLEWLDRYPITRIQIMR